MFLHVYNDRSARWLRVPVPLRSSLLLQFDMDFSGCVNDDSLGPAVQGCREDFDFTLRFEKIFLTLIPTSVFIATALPRLAYLLRRLVIVRGLYLQTVKLVTQPHTTSMLDRTPA